jgi:hypothetical protein
MNWDDLERTITCVAEVMKQPYLRVLRALFILHVLSMCWDWEMHAEDGKLEGARRQCHEILYGITGRLSGAS